MIMRKILLLKLGEEIKLLDDDITMTTMILIKMLLGRNLSTLILSMIYSQYNKWATTTISPNKNFENSKLKKDPPIKFLELHLHILHFYD